jgi:tripartite-type tricarboxylate transporter receptor subunit TctC
MKLRHRRQFLHLVAGAAVLPTLSRFACAQAYPSRPVRIIVGFAPAGGTDIMARLIGQWLSERLGQQFVIENRPGAATNIATEAVVNAPPDGSLLAACLPNASNATVYDKLNFNFIRDIAPVSGIARDTFAIEVNPSVPVKTVPELITYAKVNSGKINMASGAAGAPPVLASIIRAVSHLGEVLSVFPTAGPVPVRHSQIREGGHRPLGRARSV